MTVMLQRALSSLLLRGLVTSNHKNFSRPKSLELATLQFCGVSGQRRMLTTFVGATHLLFVIVHTFLDSDQMVQCG